MKLSGDEDGGSGGVANFSRNLSRRLAGGKLALKKSTQITQCRVEMMQKLYTICMYHLRRPRLQF